MRCVCVSPFSRVYEFAMRTETQVCEAVWVPMKCVVRRACKPKKLPYNYAFPATSAFVRRLQAWGNVSGASDLILQLHRPMASYRATLALCWLWLLAFSASAAPAAPSGSFAHVRGQLARALPGKTHEMAASLATVQQLSQETAAMIQALESRKCS